jgi:hypothetical protein
MQLKKRSSLEIHQKQAKLDFFATFTGSLGNVNDKKQSY